MFGSRAGPTGLGLSLRFFARRLGALLLSIGLPAGVLAATTPVPIDLATSVQALPIIMSGQPGCGLPPPPSLFGPGPETYSYGQASVTTGATGNHVLEVVALATPVGAPADPAILLYQGAFNPASPATNLVACDDNGTVDPSLPPTFPRLVVSASTTYTVVVLVPADPAFAPGTSTATLSNALEPTITFADKSIALGAVGESMTAASNSTGTISYAIQNPAVALIDPGTGALTTFGTGSTLVAALQAGDGGTYGSGFKEATLTVTGASAPTVTGIAPASGPTAGGTAVTISGTNLAGATSVTIGGAAATGVTVVSSTTITATTPAGTAGAKDVAVTTPGGTGTGTGLFTYVAPAATKLAFTTQPGGAVAGTVFTTQPKVAIQDASGNTMTSSTATVTLAIKASTGTTGAVLQTCGPTAAVAGIATFSGCKIDLAGTGYVLTASATGLTSADSSAFGVAAVAPTVTAISPASGPTAGGTAVTISGTNLAGATSVTIGGAAATGVTVVSLTTITATTPAGTAGAKDVAVTTPGGTGTGTGLFTYVAPAATKLAFTTQPGGAVAGTVFTTQPRVAIQDASGNTMTSSTATVTLAIKASTGTTGAVLQTCGPVAAVAGVATFSGCKIDMTGTGYVVTASATGLTSADSTAFDVAAPPATAVTNVNFSVSPASAGSAATMTVQFTMPSALAAGDTITARLTGYTLTAGALNIVVAAPLGSVATGSVSAGALDTVVVTLGNSMAAGSVSFRFPVTNPAAGTIAKAGLTVATSKDSTPVASASDIVIVPRTIAYLEFVRWPSSEVSGVVLSTQPQVVAKAADGTIVTSQTGSPILTVSVGATLTPATSVSSAMTNGIATYSGVIATLTGTQTLRNARLTATLGVFTVQSPPFCIAARGAGDCGAGSATKLAFTAQPGGAVVGQPFATHPKVAIQDASGNTVTTSTATVTLAKKAGTGTLTCGPVAAVAGVATFSGCLIDTVGTGFVLTASATGLTSADTFAFDVTMPVPAVTSIQPNSGPTTGGTPLTILGSFLTGATSVTIGGVAATNVTVVSATQITATAPAGTAGPKDVAVTTPGGTGTGVGLFTYAESVAYRLAFITQPAGAVVGAAFATQPRVAIQDANGRTVTTSTATVALASTAAMSCNANSVAAVAGIATFSGCRIDQAGTGIVLTASATGLASAASAAFNVLQPVTATKLVIAPISAPLTAGQRFGVTVSATDAAGTVNASQRGSVTLATSNVSSASRLKGVLTVPFVGGVATFSGLHFAASGQYTLTASALVLTSATSPAITVTASTTAASLQFTSQPVAEVSGVAFTNQPVVRAVLEDGTVATSFTGTVGLALGKTGGTTTAVLGGTVTAPFVNGIASFSGVRVNGTDRDLYLTATAGTLTGFSGAFRVYSTATEAAMARSMEQATSRPFSLTLDVACTSPDCLAAIKSDVCTALALDSRNCARVTVFSVSSSSSASSKRDDSSTGKAGTVPPGAALERCGEVALDANGEAILPACPIAGPGIYSYALSVPGQPLMASRPYTVLASLEGALPQAPGNLRVEPGDGVAVVSWDPPAATGVGPIIAYEVYGLQEGSPEALLARDGLTSKTLKVANGSVWRFGVRAANDVGTSDMAQSAPVAIGVAPGAPGKPRLSRSQGPSGDEVEVTWDIPPGNPAEFEAISSGGQSCRRGNFGKGFASASCRVAVESGKTYTFRVIARNAVGQAISPESDALVVSPERIDGKCGAMAQQASLVMPMADLCEAGTAGGAIKSVQGAWKWQCEGVQGGSTASCSTTTGAAALGLWTFRATPVSAALMAKAAGAGCRLQRAESVAVGIADGPGSGAVMPYGAVGIELADCEGGMADVTISYPVVVEGMAFHALVGGQWFLTPPPGTGLQVKADTVTFTIADNGPWDADPQAGIISFVGGVGYREEWLTNLPEPPASVMVKPGATRSR